MNVDNNRPYLNGEEDEYAGKRQSGMQRRPGIAESLDTAYGARHRLFGNAWFACL